MFAIGRNEMCVCVCKCVSVHCGNLHESRIANAKSREGEREREMRYELLRTRERVENLRFELNEAACLVIEKAYQQLPILVYEGIKRSSFVPFHLPRASVASTIY